MGGTHRSARWALLVVLSALAAGPPPSAWAQPGVQSTEPPLIGAPPSVGAAPIAAPVAEPADPPTPWVSVHVRAPATAQAGQEVDYRILVENRSQTSAHHVFVRVPAPTNAAYVRASPEPASHEAQIVWDMGTVGPGVSKEFLLTLKPNGAGDVEVIARVQFEHGQSVRTHVGPSGPPTPRVVPANPPPQPVPPQPMPTPEPPPPAVAKAALHLSKTGPAQAMRYDAVTFQLEVTNTGTAEARDVELTDSLPPGLRYTPVNDKDPGGNLLTWSLGTLAPGQTRRVRYDAIALELGDQENAAQVKAEGGLRATSAWRVHVNEPKLAVAVTGPQRRLLDRPAKYQITVTNSGATALTGVEVIYDLPADVQVVGTPSDNGRKEDNRIHWLLGNAPAGGRRTVTVDLTASKAVEVGFHATAKADRGLTASADAKTRFEGAVGLHVEIDKSADPLAVGGEADYTIHILNRGAVAARNVQVIVTPPEQIQLVSKEAFVEAAFAGRALTFTPISVEPGKEATFKLHVKALRAGEVKLIVEVRSDDLPTPLHEEETTTIFGDAAPPPSPVSH